MDPEEKVVLIPAIKKLIPLSIKARLKSMLVSPDPVAQGLPVHAEEWLRPCASTWPESACECDMHLGAFKQARILARILRLLEQAGIHFAECAGHDAHIAVDIGSMSRLEQLLGSHGITFRIAMRKTNINDYDFPVTRSGLALATRVPAEHPELRVSPTYFCGARRKDADRLSVLITTFNDADGVRLFHSSLARVRTLALQAPAKQMEAKATRGGEDPIDVVITTVDGSDPAWLEKFNAVLARQGVPTLAKTSNAARYTARDELRFVLRSLHYYAPYVRTIHVVTDEQCPPWLDLQHPKINLVDHKDIIDPGYLPCFNSDAIESCLWKIPGLSERFIYFNDDVLLMAPTQESTFFTSHGLPRFFASPRRIPDMPAQWADSYTMHAHLKSAAALERRGYGRPLCKYRHVPFAARKSTLQAMEAEFAEELAQTRSSPLRSETSFATISFLYPNYALATGSGVLSNIKYQYVDISWEDWRERLFRACQRTDVTVCCVNESHDAVGADSVDGGLAAILSSRYPCVAPWELDRVRPLPRATS